MYSCTILLFKKLVNSRLVQDLVVMLVFCLLFSWEVRASDNEYFVLEKHCLQAIQNEVAFSSNLGENIVYKQYRTR